MSIKIAGVVVGGRRIGRTLGFPTANMVVERELDVRDGVYAARVEIEGAYYNGMVNIGYRPSVSQERTERLLEINIFDFDHNIYGTNIEVELLKFIRKEETFDSLKELKDEMYRDRDRVEEFFKKG